MGIRLLALDTDGFERLPHHVRGCVFWEVDPSADVRTSEFDKEAWTSGLLLEWGTCAQLVESAPNVVRSSDDGGGFASTRSVVGTAFYAPPLRVPRAAHFPTSPVSADAVLLTSLRTDAGFEDTRAILLDAVVADLVQRGVRAVEAFGIRDIEVGAEEDICAKCMIDAQFLEDSGFDLVAPHHRFPRYRLVLDEGLGWKSAVEGALERLVVEAALRITIGPGLELTPARAELTGRERRASGDRALGG